MSDVKPETIKVRCPACGKKLGFPPQAVGKKAKCPACTHVFKVGAAPAADPAVAVMTPAGQTRRPIPPAPPPPQDDAGSLFDALAAAEQSAEEIALSPEEEAAAYAARAESDSAERLARAGTVEPPPMPVRGQRRAQTAAVREGTAGVDRMPSAIVTLAKGCLFCLGGALLGSLLWYIVAKAVGLELGYVAWLVGLMAGFGMQLGTRAQSNLAGVIAVLAALLGILIGKALVVALVIFPMVEKQIADAQAKQESSTKFQYDTMIEVEFEKMLANRKIDPEEASEEQLEQLHGEAKARVMKWDSEKVRVEFTKWKASQPPSQKSISGALGTAGTGILAVIIAVFSVGILDFFFVVLATISAFVIGSGRTFSAPGRRA